MMPVATILVATPLVATPLSLTPILVWKTYILLATPTDPLATPTYILVPIIDVGRAPLIVAIVEVCCLFCEPSSLQINQIDKESTKIIEWDKVEKI